ncbi:MAG TPA: hypothetical protein VLX32_11105 [Candidatus Acidoferrum sp.]|nr:hypothetical protein [Candidatus Acidoferrum sp.]
MRRWILFISACAFCIGAVLAAYRSLAPEEPSLSRYAPSGALLYLEAKDFSGLLVDWNGSRQKELWLSSADYQAFSRSRLYLRLKDASDEFAAAAGLPADMNFVSQVAGSQSGLALYDIGKLQFLYITKLDSNKAEQTALLQSRAKFETRNAGGATFYLRQDAQSGREVAFATSGGYLLLATREDLMAGALELVAGNKNPTIESESWWTRSLGAAGKPGDLRMVLNLEKIVPSPYFRSYWIQKNITDMKAYSAAVSDLFLSGSEYREERVLVKKAASSGDTPSTETGEAVAVLSRLVPPDAGAFQINSNPSADACLKLLETKLLAPHAGPGVASKIAPQVQLSSGETGGSSDMETRIDQPPLKIQSPSASSEALRELFAQNSVQASMNFQNTETDKDGVFVRFRTAVAFLGISDWNEAAVRSAIADFVRPILTASELGVSWQAKSGHMELDGLWPLSGSVRGKYLFLSDDPKLLDEITARLGQKTNTAPAVLIAGFNHAGERQSLARLTNLLDNQSSAAIGEPGRTPQFFSDNIGSLSAVLAGVSSEKIVVRDAGDHVMQTVTYEWRD